MRSAQSGKRVQPGKGSAAAATRPHRVCTPIMHVSAYVPKISCSLLYYYLIDRLLLFSYLACRYIALLLSTIVALHCSFLLLSTSFIWHCSFLHTE